MNQRNLKNHAREIGGTRGTGVTRGRNQENWSIARGTRGTGGTGGTRGNH